MYNMQNTHIIYTQYTNVQSVYIIRQAIIDKRTKPFFFIQHYRLMSPPIRGGGIIIKVATR